MAYFKKLGLLNPSNSKEVAGIIHCKTKLVERGTQTLLEVFWTGSRKGTAGCRDEAGSGRREVRVRQGATAKRHRDKHKAQIREIVISNNSGIASEANHTSNQKGI
ncbi:hypothetical protein EV359DRAFT_62313 [Lentinula novae-zelandiae]|nr:hypothetical protein EV359DRAFT_62313 [Lentinula novae-zelandiae]